MERGRGSSHPPSGLLPASLLLVGESGDRPGQVVASPVVGAVRMVTAATLPQEIVANVYLGERLRDEQDGVYEGLGVTVTREYRPTEEYPRGQEVYALTFAHEDGSDPERSSGSS